jgi:MFS transporter, DHA3 family, macrolide efflux protein
MFLAQFVRVFEQISYLRYWLAYTLSAIGFELIQFVLMVVLFDSMKTALSMGTFTAIFMFCLVMFGPIAGICVDRWERKKIFIACNVLLAILIFTLKYLHEAYWLYLLWFFASLLLTFLRPVRVALITNLFPKEDYFKANSAFMISLNLSKIGGPLIGGFLILSLPLEWVFNIIGSFFFLSLISVSTLHFRSSSLESFNQGRANLNWRDFITGIYFILSHKGLRFYIIIGFFWRLFLASQLPLFIVYIKNYLGGGTREYSLFMTILALGGALGSFVAGGIENLWSRKTMVYGGLGASYLFFAFLPISKNFLFALIIIGLSNLFFYIAHVAIHSDIQQITPNEIRGKVFASSPTLLIPIALISIFIATPLADRVGVEWVFLVSGLLALVTLPGVGYLSETFAQVFQIAPKRGADLSKSATL